jgi:hypothetical protein
MRCRQRIFPPAFAALQRPHETLRFFHMVLLLTPSFSWVLRLPFSLTPCFSWVLNRFRTSPTVLTVSPAQQKTPSHNKKRLQNRVLFSFSSDACRSWNWHLVTSNTFEAGCRGVLGPVPRPLCMRPLYQRMRIY